MTAFIQLFVLIPLLGYLTSVLLPKKNENVISWVSFGFVGLHLLCFWVFVLYWLFHGHPTLNIKDVSLFKSGDYDFFIDLAFDKVTAVYLMVGSSLTFLVTVYSRYYLHRESGYKRFFNTVAFFYLGYNITILSGNLETLFIGWEILGITSFLLIGFYRDRYLPIKNAFKVYSIYRIGDIGLILAMWMSHHLFHENITFIRLGNYELVHEHLQSHTLIGVFISAMILLTAAAKSAQLPFSAWLPRAMEGPTPSSAIFYGSLAVHLGVFLMIRTYPFWEYQTSVRVLIGLMGLFTSLLTTITARVQSNIKSQIAYSAISQIGLIFIELSVGWIDLALWHFAGNAFLRTYQLLVSPSVVSYLIKEQFYEFVPRKHAIKYKVKIPTWLLYSAYIMSVKEWNLGEIMYNLYWMPLKWGGKKVNFITLKLVMLIFTPIYLIGIYCLFNESIIPVGVIEVLPVVFSIIGLMMVLKSFSERVRARLSWALIIMNHFWVALAISFNEHFKFEETLWYLSGIVVCGTIGYFALNRLKGLAKNIDLDRFNGHSYKHPKIAFVFLVCCLGLTGFPITPTFIGEDLIFTHIHEHQIVLAFCVSMSFIIDGLAIIRIYSRVFLGPHVDSVYEMAYRSS